MVHKQTSAEFSSRFIVKNDTPGYQTAKIKNKIALRIMQNGDIALKDVFVSEEDRIPGVKAFQDINEASELHVCYEMHACMHAFHHQAHLYYFVVVSLKSAFTKNI